MEIKWSGSLVSELSVHVLFFKRRSKFTEEGINAWELGSGEAVEFFAVVTEEDDGRDTLDFVFIENFLVFFVKGIVAPGDVDFNEDEFLGGFGGEGFFGEYFLVHHDAGRAPVGAGELDHDGFFFFLTFGEGRVDVGHPVVSSCGGSGHYGDSEGCGDELFNGFHMEVSVWSRGFYSKFLETLTVAW